MATLRPAAERLREQRRRQVIGWVVVGVGALAATGVFAALIAHFGWT